MRVVLQRVLNASVEIDGMKVSQIEQGLLALVGFEQEDQKEDIDWITQKIVQMRIFSDQEAKMNLSLQDIHGEILVVSQFTLFASIKKGNRPSFIQSARPEIAIPLYEETLLTLRNLLGEKQVSAGRFGADMKVQLINDGPVTITFDSKNRE